MGESWFASYVFGVEENDEVDDLVIDFVYGLDPDVVPLMMIGTISRMMLEHGGVEFLRGLNAKITLLIEEFDKADEDDTIKGAVLRELRDRL